MKKSVILVLISFVAICMGFAGNLKAQISAFDAVSEANLANAVSLEDSVGGKVSLGLNTCFDEYSVSLDAQFSISKTFNLYNVTRFAGVPERWNGEVGVVVGLRYDRVGVVFGPVASVSYLPDYEDYILQISALIEPTYFFTEGLFVSMPVKYLYHKGYTTWSAGVGIGYEF